MKILHVFLKALVIGVAVGLLMTFDWEGSQPHLPDASYNYGICLSGSLMVTIYAAIRKEIGRGVGLRAAGLWDLEQLLCCMRPFIPAQILDDNMKLQPGHSLEPAGSVASVYPLKWPVHHVTVPARLGFGRLAKTL
jgi:hypothetical protein